jgi:hypothetical protein
MRRELTWRERWFGRRPHSQADELEETRELYHRVAARYKASYFTRYNHDKLAEGAAKLLLHAVGDRRSQVPGELVGATYTLARKLIDMEPMLAFATEPAPLLETTDTVKAVELRAWLRQLEQACESSEKLVPRWLGTIADVMAAISTDLPLAALAASDADESLTLSVELADLLDEPGLVMNAVYHSFLEAKEVGLFEALIARFHTNIWRASGITDPRRSTKPLVYPSQQEGMRGSQLAHAYFAGTPLLPIFQTQLPFTIPFLARFEHMHIELARFVWTGFRA